MKNLSMQMRIFVRELGRAGFSSLALMALVGGLFLAACTTAKDAAYSAVYVNDVAGYHDFYLAGYPAYRDVFRMYADPPADPGSLGEARLYTEYARSAAKMAEAAKASPHVLAFDFRRSLSAYAQGVAAAVPPNQTLDSFPAAMLRYAPYTRSVLIGECTAVVPGAAGDPYTVTIRIDYANSPALPEFLNEEQYKDLEIRSKIWVESGPGASPRIPFEVGASYMIYADTLEAAPGNGETGREEIGLNTLTYRVQYGVTAFIHGVDDFDRQEIYKQRGGELPRELRDNSLPARLLSTSPYQKAGGLDFDIGNITGTDMAFEAVARETPQDRQVVTLHNEGAVVQVWSQEALQYAPFIKLDASGVAGAFNSKAGGVWKKWITLAQTAQSTLRVLTTSRREAMPVFIENPQIFGGRAFTEAEYQNGAKVCMISETLAYQNGLGIGDTISLAFFNNGYMHDFDAFGQPESTTLQPISYTMSGAEPDRPAVYTIIGFFSLPEQTHGKEISYTPFDIDVNTVIVPSGSIQKEYPAPQAASLTDPDTGKELIPVTRYYLPERFGLLSVILKPGKTFAFLEEMKEEVNGIAAAQNVNFDLGGVWNYWRGYSIEGRSR